MSEWVSVEERLPDMHLRILVNVRHDYVTVGWLESGFTFRAMAGGIVLPRDVGGTGVTHWMPLPAPPAAREDK